jgi:hypothetical protein
MVGPRIDRASGPHLDPFSDKAQIKEDVKKGSSTRDTTQFGALASKRPPPPPPPRMRAADGGEGAGEGAGRTLRMPPPPPPRTRAADGDDGGARTLRTPPPPPPPRTRAAEGGEGGAQTLRTPPPVPPRPSTVDNLTHAASTATNVGLTAESVISEGKNILNTEAQKTMMQAQSIEDIRFIQASSRINSMEKGASVLASMTKRVWDTISDMFR